MSTSPTTMGDITTSVLTGVQAATAVSSIIAVEQNAASLPGATKQQIVVDTVQAGVAAAPALLSFIQSIVALFNSTGWFKHK
jgi:hypothetical protein